jgi:NifU-like protein
MSYDDLIETPPSKRYSKKLGEKILSARNAGRFTQQDAHAREMHAVEGGCGSFENGNVVALYWLVDGKDGSIVDAKFQAFGEAPLIAAAEAACEVLIGKNYDQAKRVGVELIDKKLRDQPEEMAFPEERHHLLDLVVEAVRVAVEKCSEIPLSETYHSPVPQTEGGGGYPGWLALPHEQKIAVIEKILDEEVRPYVELDAGGIEVQGLIHDRELIIAYKGSCTSCFSAIGATLSTIQQIVQTKVHPALVVVPNMDALNF